MATLAQIKDLLGEPRFNWSDPAPWSQLGQELGITFPADFREVVDAYGSILINGQLYLEHPAKESGRDLGQKIREEIEDWRENEDDFEDLPSRVGSGPGELLPFASAASGECVFFRVPVEPSMPWWIGVHEFDSPEYVAHDITFSDWLLAYLRGENVTVHSHNFAPGDPFFEPLG